MPKSELKLEDDPYLRLGNLINIKYIFIGFGMSAYFDTLKILTWAMIFICIFTIPNMFIY
jgi:hypothetical protein